MDYPAVGIRRTRYDRERRILEIDTVATTPARRGSGTTFTVDRLPPGATVAVEVDGVPHRAWRRTDEAAVAVDLTIDTHHVTVSAHRAT